jgi:hypothetical protein
LAIWRLLAVYVTILSGLFALAARRLTDLALPGTPRALWIPFLRPLLSAAFEMALLLAVPAAVLAVRACGWSLRATLAVAVALTVGTLWASTALDPGLVEPGRIAQQLIDSGREACARSSERRVQVPLVGLTWKCPAEVAPRVSGRVPGGLKASYTAASIQVSPDLRQIEFTGLALELPPTAKRLSMKVSADRGRIRGLAPWGRPHGGASGGGRFSDSVLAAWATLGAALFALSRLGPGHWLIAALLGLGAGLAPVLVYQMLDRIGGASAWYWLAVPAGPLGVLLVSSIIVAVQRVLRGRSSVARQAR